AFCFFERNIKASNRIKASGSACARIIRRANGRASRCFRGRGFTVGFGFGFLGGLGLCSLSLCYCLGSGFHLDFFAVLASLGGKLAVAFKGTRFGIGF